MTDTNIIDDMSKPPPTTTTTPTTPTTEPTTTPFTFLEMGSGATYTSVLPTTPASTTPPAPQLPKVGNSATTFFMLGGLGLLAHVGIKLFTMSK